MHACEEIMRLWSPVMLKRFFLFLVIYSRAGTKPLARCSKDQAHNGERNVLNTSAICPIWFAPMLWVAVFFFFLIHYSLAGNTYGEANMGGELSASAKSQSSLIVCSFLYIYQKNNISKNKITRGKIFKNHNKDRRDHENDDAPRHPSNCFSFIG